ncbi:hypothetical protein IT412_05950 [Candidatus Peregrinibacteria bacterium]|nr:hypothetical protein [Candidatus Peregrinibacteria bacterium]
MLDRINQSSEQQLKPVNSIHFLIHPGYLLDERQFLETPASLALEWREIGQQMLSIYLAKIAEMNESDLMILYVHDGFNELRNQVAAGSPHVDIYRQIRKALRKRLFVYTEGASPEQSFPLQLRARGFKMPAATISTQAYGEYVDACVVSYSSRLNQILGLQNPTVIKVEHSANVNQDKNLEFILREAREVFTQSTLSRVIFQSGKKLIEAIPPSFEDIETPVGLPSMLEKIEYSNQYLEFIHDAETWLEHLVIKRDVIDVIVKKLFELGFEFDEELEDKISTTILELVLNSSVACLESSDFKICLKVYFGDRGLVIDIADQAGGYDYDRAIADTQSRDDKTDQQVLYGNTSDDYPGGTGLYCLLNFAEAFAHNKKGNRVIARFDLSK